MPNSALNRVRIGLVVQAVATGALIAGPLASGSFAPDRWLPLVAGSAAGAVVLAIFAGARTRSAWTMTLGFELLALAVGGAGLADGHYIPGSVVATLVLVQLVLPSGRAAFPSAAPAPKPAPVRLTPPPVVAARPAPPSAPPAFPPPGVLINASVPPPAFPPPGQYQPPGGSILPGR